MLVHFGHVVALDIVRVPDSERIGAQVTILREFSWLKHVFELLLLIQSSFSPSELFLEVLILKYGVFKLLFELLVLQMRGIVLLNDPLICSDDVLSDRLVLTEDLLESHIKLMQGHSLLLDPPTQVV